MPFQQIIMYILQCPHNIYVHLVFISPNEVIGDIMVLASTRPPVDPDNVNTPNSKNIQPISLKFYMWVDTPLRYFAIAI